MFDTHKQLFDATAPMILGIPAYSFFVGLGLFAGLLYYFADLKHRKMANEGAVIIAFSALVCGVIGSRIPLLIEGRSWEQILIEKSIVGGLIGGMFGVMGIKKLSGIKLKLGNIIAPSIALGMAIGRLGCFFNGCCYGKIATWGIDFGDGLLRLPTQLFESAFHLTAFLILHHYKYKVQTGGLLFKLYLISYFVFRFFSEFIRENPLVWGGMSIYQILCLLGILYICSVLLLRRIEHERIQS